MKSNYFKLVDTKCDEVREKIRAGFDRKLADQNDKIWVNESDWMNYYAGNLQARLAMALIDLDEAKEKIKKLEAASK